MSLRYLRPSALLVAFVLAFACGTPWAAGGAIRLVSNASPNDAEVLRKAYSALRAADHDYHGHRRKAMEAIEEAGKALGADVKGDGKGHEPQAESDAHLRKAQSLLQTIGNASAKSGRIGKHVEHALSELSVALSMK